MNPYDLPPIAAVLDAASRGLMWLADTLEPLAGAGAASVAIVLITLLVRAALVPLGVAQARAEQTRFRLAPKLRALQERHRKSPERLQREMMKLYADEKTSPFAGLLPVLAQAPVVGIIYGLFVHATIAGHANALLTHELLGVPLGTSAVSLVVRSALDPAALLVFGAVVLALVVVAEVTRRALRPPATDASAAASPNLRWLGALQFTTAVVALFVPLAAALYLVVTATWTLAQRVLLRRRYPLTIA